MESHEHHSDPHAGHKSSPADANAEPHAHHAPAAPSGAPATMAVGTTDHAAHGAHDHAAMMSDPSMAAAMEADMRRRFWIALLFTAPVAVLAGHVPGLPMLVHPPLAGWLGLALSTPVVWYCGWIFIAGSVAALRARKLDMSVLIATGVLAAWMASLYLTAIGDPTSFYEAASMLVTFVLFGHWMEMRARRGTSDALRALFDLVPPAARVERNGAEVTLPTSEVIVGDVLRLRPGDKVPVDGDLLDGETDSDESLITGESQPVHKRVGDALVGGAINVSAAVRMRATKIGSDTVLAQIAALVAKAQNSKAPAQRLADRAAAVLVIVAVSAGIITFVSWKVLAGVPFVTALTFAIAAVVIACPDALGLATPTAVAVGTGLGAKHGVLIKDAATLEGVSRVTTVVLDKTGTLTEGHPRVSDVEAAPGVAVEEFIGVAAGLAAQSTHPLSQAIVRLASDRNISPAAGVSDVRAVPGAGVTATVGGKAALLGNARLLTEQHVVTAALDAAAERFATDGRSLTFVALDGRLLGLLGVTDPVRASSAGTMAELKRLGIRTVLLSGDVQATAERVGKLVGIDQVIAGIRPEQKADFVRQLQAAGAVTAMVGDGINDAPALAQADIGIAIGAGSDVAKQTAQVVLMRSDPADIVKAIRLSRATVRKMKQNLVWASVYNVLAIPVAAGAFYSTFGWSLRPEVSALLMSASSIIVALNAVSLRFARL